MALPAAFLDELRARTPLSAVIGRRVRLTRSGRQWKGCCPFHGEKTPSFYVYEDHYHCFGCGAHGDAIAFVMQSQGAGFTEAVEQLAAEAGLQVPKPTPEAAEAERRRHTLHSVLEAAEQTYRRRLRLSEGRAALDYLHRRGLSDATIEQFGLGWSGEGRGALIADLGREGITSQHLVDAGLMRIDDETGRQFELFFNRVMFPIRDRRGRTISFGGRVLGDGQPKYVNGPETALFSKRRNLYGLDLARDGVRGGAAVVVVEGYMDVIALAQASFPAAVAPLGTALTEDQLGELWRLSPAPVLCFDGDAAGVRAAARAAEIALPLLSAERTLRFVTLPQGEDPDSLTRSQGTAGFAALLEAARPLSDALYDLMRPGGAATPEQRAAFRTRLEEAAKRIPDSALASEYRRVLLDRFFADRPPSRRPQGGFDGKRGDGRR
ncbi:MAG: DNA primase, partial [Rhodospirillales bacterium]|nr:DNA primase [Rhodospirillales bacterium]